MKSSIPALVHNVVFQESMLLIDRASVKANIMEIELLREYNLLTPELEQTLQIGLQHNLSNMNERAARVQAARLALQTTVTPSYQMTGG